MEQCFDKFLAQSSTTKGYKPQNLERLEDTAMLFIHTYSDSTHYASGKRRKVCNFKVDNLFSSIYPRWGSKSQCRCRITGEKSPHIKEETLYARTSPYSNYLYIDSTYEVCCELQEELDILEEFSLTRQPPTMKSIATCSLLNERRYAKNEKTLQLVKKAINYDQSTLLYKMRGNVMKFNNISRLRLRDAFIGDKFQHEDPLGEEEAYLPAGEVTLFYGEMEVQPLRTEVEGLQS